MLEEPVEVTVALVQGLTAAAEIVVGNGGVWQLDG